MKQIFSDKVTSALLALWKTEGKSAHMCQFFFISKLFVIYLKNIQIFVKSFLLLVVIYIQRNKEKTL